MILPKFFNDSKELTVNILQINDCFLVYTPDYKWSMPISNAIPSYRKIRKHFKSLRNNNRTHVNSWNSIKCLIK